MRSSYCNFGDCVEVEDAGHGQIIMRDTKSGEELTFTHEEWEAFLLGAKAGEFDFPA